MFFSSRLKNSRYSSKIWNKALSPYALIAGFDQKKCSRERVIITILRVRPLVIVLCAWRWIPIFFFFSISSSFPGNTRRDELKLDQKGMRFSGRWTRGTRLEGLSTLFYFRSSLLDGRPLVGTLPYISSLSRRLRQQVAVKPSFSPSMATKSVNRVGRSEFVSIKSIIFVLEVNGKGKSSCTRSQRKEGQLLWWDLI